MIPNGWSWHLYMMTFIWLRITSGGNETQNKGAFLFLQQQAEKSLMSIQWNQSPDLWCIIVCAHSWNYEEEMLMSCCWRHHESNASMCVAYWMIMTKCTISPVSKPAEQWLQIGQCVLRITREPGSNANQCCCPLKHICTCRTWGNKLKYPA